ncbi:AlpA family phage regulatory protein [Pseudonocardia sp. TMWB2A]|uniref:AlpA family phage regulatory protein n=1 Tax=Pseudonocardia sp. TMWB2A TaxID=687430 RepID=UPI00307E5365
MQNPILYDRLDLRRRGIKLSNSSLLRMEALGVFPKRKYLSTRTVVWDAEAIDQHIATLTSRGER